MSYPIESFMYRIDDDEKELDVIGNVMIRDREYIITDDGYNNKYVFYINEEETPDLIEDEDLSEYILNQWRDERYGTSSKKSDDWDDDDEYFESHEDEEDEAIEENLHIVEEDEEFDF